MNVIPLEIVIVGILFLAPLILTAVVSLPTNLLCYIPISGIGITTLSTVHSLDILGADINSSLALAICGALIGIMPYVFVAAQLTQQEREQKRAKKKAPVSS